MASDPGQVRRPDAERAPAARPAERSETEQARALVERFCAKDFEGHAERYEYAVLSEERAKLAREQEEELPLVFDGPGSPFVAVASCRVVSVEVSGNAGSATVAYERLAESTGGAVVRPVAERKEQVRLALRQEGGRWWVVDPPAPHIGLDALIAAYREELAHYTPEWEKTATDVQRASRDRVAENLARLEQLRAPAGGRPGSK